MESNGKSVKPFRRAGELCDRSGDFRRAWNKWTTFFHQLFTSGNGYCSSSVCGRFKNNQMEKDVVIQAQSQQKLCANVAAQIVAFACGKDDKITTRNLKADVHPALLSVRN